MLSSVIIVDLSSKINDILFSTQKKKTQVHLVQLPDNEFNLVLS